ncbi:NUDIX domain-containing protein [Oceanobacter mangrovi]|uniref:NUDIX domain-containing protein n=1 Tax=Oceanobacter mangrovi TaxID=2862510 RepID=UPI001C8D1A28|nr:NUDIX domain-containing protein [Oceanobacter mangrovi]
MNQSQINFGHEDWQLEKRETVFQGFFRMDRLSLRHRTFAGDWTPVFERELFERGEAVCVMLFDPARDRLIFTEQFRIGALADGHSPWLIELVAGMVEDGESWEAVAERETLEEAGCRFQQLIPIHHYWASPGGCSEKIHLYCGLLDSDGVGGLHGLEDEHEDIRLVVMSFDEAWQLLESGRINNAASIIALQWLKIHHSELLAPAD